MMKVFAEIVNDFSRQLFLAKSSILDVRLGSEYPFGIPLMLKSSDRLGWFVFTRNASKYFLRNTYKYFNMEVH